MVKKKILFICTGNSARSQIAEGLVNSLFFKNYKAYSGGTNPSKVKPLAIQVMKEIGIDISHHRSKNIREFYGEDFDLVVTVCDNAKKVCPVFPGAKNTIHKSFKDPAEATGTKEQILTVFNKIRDEIKEWLIDYLENLKLSN